MENAIQGVTSRSTEWECGKEREIVRERESRLMSTTARETSKVKRALRDLGISK